MPHSGKGNIWSIVPEHCSKEAASTSTQDTLSRMEGEDSHPPSAPQLIHGYRKQQMRIQGARCPHLEKPQSQNWHHKVNPCQVESTTVLSCRDGVGEARRRQPVPGEHRAQLGSPGGSWGSQELQGTRLLWEKSSCPGSVPAALPHALRWHSSAQPDSGPGREYQLHSTVLNWDFSLSRVQTLSSV